MSTVRSRRWTVEVGELKHQFWQEQPVECVWIDYWQHAGSDTIEVASVSLWAKPWGEEIVQLTTLDVRDRVSGWLRALIAKHRPGVGPVDTAPEAEVLEADDTVPVERLAHWLHGEFDTSAENSDLLPWAQEREGIKDRYRRASRALMSQLPELFR